MSKNEIYMFIWDMDNTLGCNRFAHSRLARDRYLKEKDPLKIETYLKADFYDLAGFRYIIQCLQKRNIKVGIASNGNYKVITNIMKYVFSNIDTNNPFNETNIISLGSPLLLELMRTGALKQDKKYHKAMYVSYLAEKHNLSNHQVVYFDDNTELVDGAKEKGIHAYHTPEFTRNTWLNILAADEIASVCDDITGQVDTDDHDCHEYLLDQSQPRNTLRFYIEMPSGEKFSLTVNFNSTVADAKAELKNSYSGDLSKLYLTNGSEQYLDDMVFDKNTPIINGSTLKFT